MRSEWVMVDGISVHVVRVGEPSSSPPLVLVHGMVVASNGALPLARCLADAGLDVHVPDLPGFGRSGKARRALDVDGLAAAVTGYLRAAGLEECSLLGNSFGTQVAAAVAAMSPSPVRRLVLLSPTIDRKLRAGWTRVLPPGRPGGRARTGPAGRLQAVVRDALVPPPSSGPGHSLPSLLVREYLAAGLLRALSTVRHALRDDIALRMPSLSVPTLVLRAGDDGVVSPQWAAGLARSAPHGEYVEVPGIDHDAQFHAPDVLAPVILEFLEAASAGDPPAVRSSSRDAPGPQAETDTSTSPASARNRSTSRNESGAGRDQRGRVDRKVSR